MKTVKLSFGGEPDRTVDVPAYVKDGLAIHRPYDWTNGAPMSGRNDGWAITQTGTGMRAFGTAVRLAEARAIRAELLLLGDWHFDHPGSGPKLLKLLKFRGLTGQSVRDAVDRGFHEARAAS